MKHFKLIFLFVMFTSIAGIKAFAYDAYVDGIYYIISGNEAMVTYMYQDSYGYHSYYSGNIVIPESVTYNGKIYSVTSIGKYAFYKCTGLKNIDLPSTLVEIGKEAFCYCKGLKSIVLPSTLEEIGSCAFYKCNAIETIYSKVSRVFALPTDNVFDQIVYDNAVLYVPTGTKYKYKQIQGWKNFLNVEEYPVNVITTNSGYFTFYDSNHDYLLPSGLSAQVVTNASNNKLTYQTIADGNTAGIVPKGTAVMLASDGKQPGTFVLNATAGSAPYTGTNLLHGSDIATMTTGNGYHFKLSYGQTGTAWDNVFGWYWGIQNGNPFLIEGHKAWLVVPASDMTRADKGYTIDGDAIDFIDMETGNDVNDIYFDIQGRRIATPTRSGLYIKNGKKVIIK